MAKKERSLKAIYAEMHRESEIFHREDLMDAEELRALMYERDFQKKILGNYNVRRGYSLSLLVSGDLWERKCGEADKPALHLCLAKCRVGPRARTLGVRFKGKTAIVVVTRDYQRPGA